LGDDLRPCRSGPARVEGAAGFFEGIWYTEASNFLEAVMDVGE